VNKTSHVRNKQADLTNTAIPGPDHDGTGAPLREQIARLAYSYWEARGCPEGSPDEDWLRAEANLGKQAARRGRKGFVEEVRGGSW